MSESKKTLVFVYGTLKTGEPNYYLMQGAGMEGCKPRGKYKSVEKFPLVVASRYNIPFLLYAPGQGHIVEGELYEVNDKQLARMDDLERHPQYYERQDITLTPVTENDNRSLGTDTVTAQAYFLVKYRPDLLTLRMMSSYSDYIDGKKYVGPDTRKTNPEYRYEVHTGYSEPENS